MVIVTRMAPNCLCCLTILQNESETNRLMREITTGIKQKTSHGRFWEKAAKEA